MLNLIQPNALSVCWVLSFGLYIYKCTRVSMLTESKDGQAVRDGCKEKERHTCTSIYRITNNNNNDGMRVVLFFVSRIFSFSLSSWTLTFPLSIPASIRCDLATGLYLNTRKINAPKEQQLIEMGYNLSQEIVQFPFNAPQSILCVLWWCYAENDVRYICYTFGSTALWVAAVCDDDVSLFARNIYDAWPIIMW